MTTRRCLILAWPSYLKPRGRRATATLPRVSVLRHSCRINHYQSIKDVAIEMEELRHELQEEAGLDRSVQPLSTIAVASTGGAPASTASAIQSATETAQVEAARTTSSAEYLVTQIKRHKFGS